MAATAHLAMAGNGGSREHSTQVITGVGREHHGLATLSGIPPTA